MWRIGLGPTGMDFFFYELRFGVCWGTSFGCLEIFLNNEKYVKPEQNIPHKFSLLVNLDWNGLVLEETIVVRAGKIRVSPPDVLLEGFIAGKLLHGLVSRLGDVVVGHRVGEAVLGCGRQSKDTLVELVQRLNVVKNSVCISLI